MTGLKLVDNIDREYISYDGAFKYLEEDDKLFILDKINPDISKTYSDIYEVPTDAEGLILEITGLELAREKAYIDLGLD